MASRWIVFSLLLVACGGGERRFPMRPPLGRDTDTKPVGPRPAAYVSPQSWDVADKTVFRPLTRVFAVAPGGEAVNVNSLDEVPDSAWFENRGAGDPGPCAAPDPDPDDPDGSWIIDQGKPNGATPGFRASIGARHFMFKVDPSDAAPRANAASVVGSRLYHAAGFFVACERVIDARPAVFQLKPGLVSKDNFGFERAFETGPARAARCAPARRLAEPLGRARAEHARHLDRRQPRARAPLHARLQWQPRQRVAGNARHLAAPGLLLLSRLQARRGGLHHVRRHRAALGPRRGQPRGAGLRLLLGARLRSRGVARRLPEPGLRPDDRARRRLDGAQDRHRAGRPARDDRGRPACARRGGLPRADAPRAAARHPAPLPRPGVAARRRDRGRRRRLRGRPRAPRRRLRAVRLPRDGAGPGARGAPRRRRPRLRAARAPGATV